MTIRSPVSVATGATALGMRMHGVRLVWLICGIGWVACSPEQPAYDAATWKLSTVPGDGDREVDRQGRITLDVARGLLPSSVSRSAITMHSGNITPWLDLRVEPVRRQVWITLRSPLDAETTYALKISGLVDLDGLMQAEPYVAYFRTGTQLGVISPDPGIDPAQIITLLQSHCARGACHDGEHSTSALDLSSAEGIEATARNRASQVYIPSDRPPPRGSLFTAAPLIIDANVKRGDPARSYIVYKLLGDEHILGDPMPPPGETALEGSEIQLIADWIRAGAATRE